MPVKTYTIGNSLDHFLEIAPEGRILRIQVQEKQLGMIRRGKSVYVFEAFCPHRGQSLTQGSINSRNEIICPLHQYRFDLQTGKVKAGYCRDLEVYPANLTSKGLEIKIPQ
ncbi:Rieske (2Fe-2S) protein [Algoriphagus namhaensis]